MSGSIIGRYIPTRSPTTSPTSSRRSGCTERPTAETPPGNPMVQFTLPKNSKVTEGKTWPPPARGRNLREYRIYRWNPEDGNNPRLDTYQVDLDDCGPMVL